MTRLVQYFRTDYRWVWVVLTIAFFAFGATADAHRATLTRTNPTAHIAGCHVTIRVRYPGPGARWRIVKSTCTITQATPAIFSIAFDRECVNHPDRRPLDAGYDFANRTVMLEPGRIHLPHWHGVLFRYGEVFHALVAWRETDGMHRVGVLRRGPRRPVDCVVAVMNDLVPGPRVLADGTVVHNPGEVFDWGYFPRGVPPVVMPMANPSEGKETP